LYVLSAMTAWLYGVGQDSDWPQALQLRLLALLAGCAEVSRQAPNNSGRACVAGRIVCAV
jgi:hypothetical protein